ncbi:MAG: hypothetical protein IID46_05220, partial [Planctomycetes bacterium]|nr:hypothetical protein [Planctomycetota bacterium]
MFIELVTLGAFLVICLLVFLIGDTINGGRRTARSVAESQFVPGSRASRWASLSLKLKRAIAGVIPQSNSEIEKIERDLK